ncbi:MAG: tolB protein precursor protein [Myxococcales bacterium]|nr:tolB protein precursor protein [Myxococcales bacterium]
MLTLLAILLACTTTPAGTPPLGRIAFVAENGGIPETWAVVFPSFTPAPLAGAGSFPGAPDPLGTETLLVTSNEVAGVHREQLWLVPFADAPPRALAPAAEFIRNPAWSSDGQSVVFESSALSFRDLFVVPRDGGEAVRLTDAPGGSFDPIPSPDGTTITYASSRDGDLEIYAQVLDLGPTRRLTSVPGEDRRPAFRPDGGRIGWLATRDGRARVWTMAADGSDALPLLADTRPVEHLDFAWSPDGIRVVLVEQASPTALDVVIVDAVRRRELARLTGGINEQPAWSPDGAWLVFSSTRSGDRDLWLVRPDGTDLRQLTTREGADWLPRWGR